MTPLPVDSAHQIVGHLGAVGVGDVGLELHALAVQALGVTGQKLARGAGLATQLVDARLALAIQWFTMLVLRAVQGHDLGRGLV